MLPDLLPHHAETVRRTTGHFSRDPAVRALLLGGSLAHGFATAASDLDIMIVVSDDDHADRLRTARTCQTIFELAPYPGGYVDGKYVSVAFLREVAARGSEPARFAFQDAVPLFSHVPELPDLVRAIARYPVEEKAARIRRFHAQFEAWQWFAGEALKRDNPHLLHLAAAKLTLFGGRMILAHNELLYPFHKWFLRVLAGAPQKPAGLMPAIDRLARTPGAETIGEFVRTVRDFRDWEKPPAGWPAQFMQDSELNWLGGPAPVDDL